MQQKELEFNMRIKLFLKHFIPSVCYSWAKRFHCILFFWRYMGCKVTCPICGWSFGRFMRFMGKDNSQCPRCFSVERHRLLWLYLKERTNFFTDHLKMLYVAPMYFLQKKFSSLTNIDYISADISFSIATVKMDIFDIAMPDNRFDSIICNHVLEHVPDDRKATKELLRVLKPGGWAILQSPIDYSLEKTYEDSNVKSFEDRQRLFGQYDHEIVRTGL